jgi:anti-sigma regulatory factor (Ser/Thr protein kinase)
MTDLLQIAIQNEIDLVTARMKVRDAARRMGMSLADQSRISLATSSLANALGLGKAGVANGSVTIECLQNGSRKGLQICCFRDDCDGYAPPVSYFSNERWMVDELEMFTHSPERVEVRMIKWMAM